MQNKLNELKPGETYKDKAQILYDLNDTQEKNDRHHETKKINVIMEANVCSSIPML